MTGDYFTLHWYQFPFRLYLLALEPHQHSNPRGGGGGLMVRTPPPPSPFIPPSSPLLGGPPLFINGEKRHTCAFDCVRFIVGNSHPYLSQPFPKSWIRLYEINITFLTNNLVFKANICVRPRNNILPAVDYDERLVRHAGLRCIVG